MTRVESSSLIEARCDVPRGREPAKYSCTAHQLTQPAQEVQEGCTAPLGSCHGHCPIWTLGRHPLLHHILTAIVGRGRILGWWRDIPRNLTITTAADSLPWPSSHTNGIIRYQNIPLVFAGYHQHNCCQRWSLKLIQCSLWAHF